MSNLGSFSARQSYAEDYRKIQAAYEGKSSLSFTVQYRSYDTNLNTPDTILYAKYHFKKNKFYCKIDPSETIKDDNYYLAIDHSHKMMLLNYAKDASANFSPVRMVDSFILKQNPQIEKIDLGNGKSRRYIIRLPNSELAYKTVLMEFDLQTYLVKKLVLYIKPPKTPMTTRP